jgi:hypothetical protein
MWQLECFSPGVLTSTFLVFVVKVKFEFLRAITLYTGDANLILKNQ